MTFDLFSKDSEFDPLKPDNWFTENWNRIPNETEDDEWNNIAYRMSCTYEGFGHEWRYDRCI